MKKVYNVESVPSVQKLSEFLNEKIHRIDPNLKTEIYNVLEGTEKLDAEVKLKTSELQITKQILLQKEQLLIQKDRNLETLKETGTVDIRQEFIDSLHKLYPKDYPAKFENWPDTLPMKKAVDDNNVYLMEYNTKIYKEELEKKEQEDIKREFIDILPKLYPQWYPVNFKDWPADSWGKGVVDRKEYKVIEGQLPIYKQWLANKKELIDILPKIMPDSYPVKYENWTNQYGKQLLDQGKFDVIGQSLPFYRKQLVEKEQENIKKEFIKSLNELYPDSYSTDPTQWFNKDGKPHPMKVHYDTNNFYVMEHNTKIYRKQLEEIKAKKLEDVKRFKEEEEARKEQLLNDKEAELVRLKELLSLKELELANKSLIKNKVVKETEKLLAEQDIKLQNLLNVNEDLDFKIQYANNEVKIKETEKDILSKLLVQKNVELKCLLNERESAVNHKSFEKNQLIDQLKEEIKDLNKQILEHDKHTVQSISLNEVGCQPGESLLEKLILNSLNLDLSPINNQGVGNQNLAVNFDLNDIHTTHSSIILAGDLSSVEADSSN